MGVVRKMATSVTAEGAATVVAARVAARQACHGVREPTTGARTAPSPRASDPEIEVVVERLRRLRERGLLTAHEFEIALDRVTGP